jgi:hypothetical protein
MLFEQRMLNVSEFVNSIAPLYPLAHVGEEIVDPQIRRLSTTLQAAAAIKNDWEDVWLDAINEVSSRLVRTGNRPAYQHWNDIAHQFDRAAEEAGISTEVAAAVEMNFPDDWELVGKRMNTMIACSAIEWCYEPVIRCSTVRDFTKWIFQGRLPCGMTTVKGECLVLVY